MLKDFETWLELVDVSNHDAPVKRRMDWIGLLLIQLVIAAWAACMICLFQIGQTFEPVTAQASARIWRLAMVPDKAHKGTPPPGWVLPPTKYSPRTSGDTWGGRKNP